MYWTWMDGNNFYLKNNKAVNTWRYYKTIQTNIQKIKKTFNNGFKLLVKTKKWQA